MSIKDFFKDARRKGPVKRTPALVENSASVTEPEINETEKNLLHASMGFRFKCGVCQKTHKSSIRERVKSLSVCVGKIMRQFGGTGSVWKNNRYVKSYGNREASNGLGVRFLPDPETADTMAFTYRMSNALAGVRPTHGAFPIMHPKLSKRFDELSKRLDEVLNREIIEELSLKEALGAPNSFDYIRARRDVFQKRAEADFERIKKEQEAFDPEAFQVARDWKKLKPEKWKIGEIIRGKSDLEKWFKRRTPYTEPVKYAKINGGDHYDEAILGWFDTMSGHPVWDTNSAGSVIKVLFDVGTVEGFPAISWGLVTAREKPTRHHTEYKGSTIINFVSLWNGKMFMNMGAGSYLLKVLSDRNTLVGMSPERGSVVVDKGENE